MKRQDREKESGTERRREERETRERKVGPPIEREHETRQGIDEEDEKRKRERERR